MFTHSARFASVSLSGASPDVKANSINLVDKVVQRSISAQGTLSEGVDLYIPIFLAETEPQQAVRSAGDGLPVLMMADPKGSGETMTYKEFKVNVLVHAVGQAKLLAQASCLEDIKIEPEQLRRNVATILAVLTETEEFLYALSNERSDSDA